MLVDRNTVWSFYEQGVPWSIPYRGEQMSMRVEFLNPVQLVIRNKDVAVRTHDRARD